METNNGRLAELSKNIRDQSNNGVGSVPNVVIPSLLEGLPQTQAISEAAAELKKAKKAYQNAIDGVVDLIRGWRGNDPVTAIYKELFEEALMIEPDETRDEMERQWQTRLRRKIPPGFKDANKPDTGIGDYAIWLAILKLGRDHQKDLIFVTGEEKTDWFVRIDKEGIYPRPELIDEYRRASGGRVLHLSKLADMLAEMEAPADVVREVRVAEAEANTAVQTAASLGKNFADSIRYSPRTSSAKVEDVSFDYSRNDGVVVVECDGSVFPLKFSKGSDTSIHLYRSYGVPQVARIKNAKPGQSVNFDQFDSSSAAYLLQRGESFLARSESGRVLAGRLVNISDDSRGASEDNVSFLYSVFNTGDDILIP
ncbi:PIN-like domain-containing protein [Rhizobium tumorigenes]|uniref:PIN-like domain-containing protein n=1 Tax=Rhizobium tumorigenes TaxID=2041385 RepID=UPI00241EB923|nr:PIN-like domain-containing protein [Rhizobium tumorigenes]WFS02378.1 PIN-like domain-containing protein [Rhizobium tumorigenes]